MVQRKLQLNAPEGGPTPRKIKVALSFSSQSPRRRVIGTKSGWRLTERRRLRSSLHLSCLMQTARVSCGSLPTYFRGKALSASACFALSVLSKNPSI